MPSRLRAWSLLLALSGCHPPDHDSPAQAGDDTHGAADSTVGSDSGASAGLNVVFVLADDQSLNTMWAMPTVNARLVPESVQFTRAYVTVPMCCPVRGSFLSGGWYPRDTGVLTNMPPMGGVEQLVDTDTLGTRLQGAGIATALIGKYLNGYETDMAPYVPPGWDEWVGLGTGNDSYAQQVVVGSSDANASEGTITDTGGQYITDYLFDEAIDFVDQHQDQRFFLYLAPMSPHLAGTPEHEDEGLYPDYAPRPPSWNEADVSDKPAWIQQQPLLSDASIKDLDGDAATMLRNLASLDRDMGLLLDDLDARGLLENTVIVYASDNGYLNGEHRLADKGVPYEEAVHMPLLVRMPGVASRGDTRLVQINTDVAATVLDLFDAPATGEGISLRDALTDPTLQLRDHIYMDSYTPGTPVWAGVITDQYKYVEWGTGETELYDLTADPYELTSLPLDTVDAGRRATWGAWVDEHRALAITTTDLPSAELNVPYTAQVDHWGGTDPVVLTVNLGALPAGLHMDTDGLITGTPIEPGSFTFSVEAQGTRASQATGRTETFYSTLTLTVGAAPVDHAERFAPTQARLHIHTRPGVAVQVYASPDKTIEGMRHASDTVVAGPDGVAVLTLDGLRTDRTWYWVALLDGLRGPHGVIPGARAPGGY